jgi:chemotaxis protein methyltransferase CheR
MVLSIEMMGKQINEILGDLKTLNDQELETFCKRLKETYDQDFTQYSHDFLNRRINIAMKREGIVSFEKFTLNVLTNRSYYDEFFTDVSINVTEFFRNPHSYKNFLQYVVPVLKTFPFIKIWSAGCATGEEAYSLAILLDHAGLLHKSRIYATDFNESVLKKAKNGIFSKEQIEIALNNYQLVGFNKNFKEYFEQYENCYEIKHYLKERVLFLSHDLTSDGVLNEFEVIFFKNVIIYFNDSLQNRVLQLIDNSLVREGYLVLGSSEKFYDEAKSIQKTPYDNAIYQKKGV